MKKVLVVMLIMITCFASFAATENKGTNTITESADLSGSSAYVELGYDNSDLASVIVGFSSNEINNLSDTPAGFGDDGGYSLALTKDENTTTASYGAAEDIPLYIFYQIISNNNIKFKLKAAGPLTSGTNKLNWGVYSYNNGTTGTALFTTNNTEATSEDLTTFIYDGPAENSYGKAYSERIVIKTSDFSRSPLGNYSGKLSLIISSVE